VRRLIREPIADAVVAHLRAAIETGKLSPGSRIKLAEVAEKLGVSQMPIRQAFSLLERDGLVKTDRWRGTTVTGLDAAFIRDIYVFRETLERSVAAKLARHPFESRTVRALIAEGRRAAASGDISQMLDLDVRFHTMLYDAYRNRVLSDVMVGLWTHVRRVMHTVVFPGGAYRSGIWDEHAAIVDAIDAGDPDRAATSAGTHIASACGVALHNLEVLHSSTGHVHALDKREIFDRS
jgi:DNA-binding GntR family transcriptional regulator